MLDSRSLILLNAINTKCEGSGYKVLRIEDLASEMPKKYAYGVDEIRRAISELSAREYVSVKYEDENEVCLTPLSKGRFLFENVKERKSEQTRNNRKHFLYSFLGGFAGCAIATVIAQVVIALTGAM